MRNGLYVIPKGIKRQKLRFIDKYQLVSLDIAICRRVLNELLYYNIQTRYITVELVIACFSLAIQNAILNYTYT